MSTPRGISVVARPHAKRPSRVRQFFAPLYVTLPGFVRSSFRRIAGVWGQAVGPVNSGSSWGGIEVTPELALSLSAVWGCVWRYANTICTLPLMYMRTGPGNSAKVASDQPLYSLLHDRPNSEMSASIFWQSMVMSMMLWGQGYAEKLKVGGRIVGLRPLRPEFMTTYRAVDGTLRWKHLPAGEPERDFGADDLFVVIDRTVDGYVGISRIEYARHSFGLSVQADRAAGVSWRNNLRASGILVVDKVLSTTQRDAYREQLAEFVGTGTGTSADRQGGVLVAEAATKFEPITMKSSDVELLQSRRFNVEDICRWYDTPPVLIGHAAEGQTMWGSGIEQIILGWLKLGLAPLLRRIEQEIWRQLLTPAEQATYFAEYNLEALLRADSAGRATFISQMVQNGIYTRNEVRARESLPPVEGGDVLTVQSNLTPLDRLGEVAEAAQLKANMRSFLGMDDQPSGDKGREA